MTEMNPIRPIDGLKIPEVPGLSDIQTRLNKQQGSPSFSKVLGEYFNDVNSMQNNAAQSVRKLATGEITDIHQVMMAMNEADVAFKLMMEIRNKLFAAYKEIIKTPL
ncbi:MAG: flagellar hook-basal body complex protein FliE [Candidatus Auribacterota bacterium]|jgi:flagellar hook-basal body complex protein FliE|nr:flagellar hook-basal body complex protein FliE [Candidatus Auribacterota bacterium]